MTHSIAAIACASCLRPTNIVITYLHPNGDYSLCIRCGVPERKAAITTTKRKAK